MSVPDDNNSKRVFLCHSRGDKAQVREYYHRLRTDGLNPWLDEEDLLPGQIWEPEIRKAVKSSAAVLVFLSRASITSAGFVHKEIKLALDVADAQPEGTIFIIPARLEDCEVPDRLQHIQWTDLFNQGGYDRLLRTFRKQGLVSTKEDLSPRTNPRDGLKYVWVPPGRFRMGCSEGDTECRADEKPPHDVEISRGFRIGQTLVTVQAYDRYAKETGAPKLLEKDVYGRLLNVAAGDPNLPAVAMSWDEAVGYCTWAGGRLPTEAEWEYSGRAGSAQARYGPLDEIAWYGDNSGSTRIDSADLWKKDPVVKSYAQKLFNNGNGPRTVARLKPNAWGLYDTLGNVWEWTADWFDEKYYQRHENRDPKGPSSGDERVLRGGSWTFIRRSSALRSAIGMNRVTGSAISASGVSGNNASLDPFSFSLDSVNLTRSCGTRVPLGIGCEAAAKFLSASKPDNSTAAVQACSGICHRLCAGQEATPGR